jgi:hypothetical protein
MLSQEARIQLKESFRRELPTQICNQGSVRRTRGQSRVLAA